MSNSGYQVMFGNRSAEDFLNTWGKIHSGKNMLQTKFLNTAILRKAQYNAEISHGVVKLNK